MTWNPLDWKMEIVFSGITTIEKNPFDEDIE